MRLELEKFSAQLLQSSVPQKNSDEDLIADYMDEDVYEKLRGYAKAHELRFKVKEEFLKILQYYDQIRTE